MERKKNTLASQSPALDRGRKSSSVPSRLVQSSVKSKTSTGSDDLVIFEDLLQEDPFEDPETEKLRTLSYGRVTDTYTLEQKRSTVDMAVHRSSRSSRRARAISKRC